MVPIYAACAWFALVYKDYALYFDVFRETYEAVTIYSFFALLIAFYGGKGMFIIRDFRVYGSKASERIGFKVPGGTYCPYLLVFFIVANGP